MTVWWFRGSRPRYAAVVGMALALSVLLHLGAGSHDSVGAETRHVHALGLVTPASVAPTEPSGLSEVDAFRPASGGSYEVGHPGHPPRKPSHPQPVVPVLETISLAPLRANATFLAPCAGPANPVTHSILRC